MGILMNTRTVGIIALAVAAMASTAHACDHDEPSPSATATPTTGPASFRDGQAGVRPPALAAQAPGPFGSRRTTGATNVALTFDDGPDPRYTPEVLGMLREYRVRATFCLVGLNASRFPHLVRAIAADGHTLCNHSWDHDMRLGAKSPDAIRANLSRTNDAIRAAAPGASISYYRQPGGNWTPTIVAVAGEFGMTSLDWTIDPQDWRGPAAGSIAAAVDAGTAPGAIVLLHDGGGDRSGTIVALRSILPNLTRRFQLAPLPPRV